MFTLAAAETIAAVAGTATALTYTLFGMELSAAGVETYKKLASGQMAIAAATIYTAPASTTTFVKSIHLVNATGTAVSGIKLFLNGTGVGNQVTGSFTIQANGWAVYEEDGWRFYDSSGSLQAPSVPRSGALGDFLTKSSATNYATQWSTAAAVRALLAIERLTADRDYYVATTGSDANDGLAVGTPFLTKQKAMDTIAALGSTGGYNITVHVADGTYTGGLQLKGWNGVGTIVTFLGNSSTPANCIISTTAINCIENGKGGFFGIVRFNGFSFAAGGVGGYFHILTRSPGRIQYTNCRFGATGFCHIGAAYTGAVVEPYGANTITASAPAFHFYADTGGVICNTQDGLPSGTVTYTLTGTPNFGSGFVNVVRGGLVVLWSFTSSGAATGVRFNVETTGLLDTNGSGNANYFPGSAVGTTATGGVYH